VENSSLPKVFFVRDLIPSEGLSALDVQAWREGLHRYSSLLDWPRKAIQIECLSMHRQEGSNGQETRHRNLGLGYFCAIAEPNIAGILDMKELAGFAARLPGVVQVAANLYTCSEPGQQESRVSSRSMALTGSWWQAAAPSSTRRRSESARFKQV